MSGKTKQKQLRNGQYRFTGPVTFDQPIVNTQITNLNLMFEYIFNATVKDGTVDVTDELLELIEEANGKPVFILPGIYLINDLDPDCSVNLQAVPGTVTFLNHLGSGGIDLLSNEQYFIDNTVSMEVSAIADATFDDGWSDTSNDSYVSELTVTDTTGLETGMLMFITSNDIHPYTAAETKKAYLGEAFLILDVSSTKVYVQGRLHWADLYTPGSAGVFINTVPTDRTFQVSGINFKAADTVIAGQTITWKDMFGARKDVTGITRPSGTTAIVVCDEPHELVGDEVIQIEGASAASYSVTAPVLAITDEYTFTYTIPAEDDTGSAQTQSPASPATGTITWRLVIDQTNDNHHSGCINVRNTPYALIENCVFSRAWDLGVAIRRSPLSLVRNCKFLEFSNNHTENENTSGRLGYGVLINGPSYGTVIDKCSGTQGRHLITTGCTEITDYDVDEAYRIGQPTDILYTGCVSHNSFGIPFDTHEEASGVTIEGCKVYNPQRGPNHSSYPGIGVQIRCRNTQILNYYQRGGIYGIRYAATEQPNSEHFADNIRVEGLTSSGNSDAAIRVIDQSGLTYPPIIRVGTMSVKNCGWGLHVEASAKVDVDVLNCTKLRVRAIRANDASIVRVANLNTNLQNIPSTGSNSRFIATMYGTSQVYIGVLNVVRGTNASQPTQVFTTDDSTSGKKVGIGKIIYDDPSALTGEMIIIEAADRAQFTWQHGGEPLMIDVKDETTALTAAVLKTFVMARDYLIVSIAASLTTGSSSGAVTVDLKVAGTTILGTNKLSIDESETSTSTAATPVDYSTMYIRAGSVVTVEVTGAGTNAAGLKLQLNGFWV